VSDEKRLRWHLTNDELSFCQEGTFFLFSSHIVSFPLNQVIATVTAIIPGQFSFNDTAGLSTLNTTQVKELAESLGSTIESIACENVTNSETSCDVNVTSINGGTFFQRRRLISRRLEALFVEYDVILKLFCNTDCSDTQTLATNITGEIQGTVAKSFNDGSLLSTLKNATDDSSVFAYLAPAKSESINFGEAVIFVTTAAPSKAPTVSANCSEPSCQLVPYQLGSPFAFHFFFVVGLAYKFSFQGTHCECGLLTTNHSHLYHSHKSHLALPLFLHRRHRLQILLPRHLR
jgi:hypothetical protein